MANAGSSHVVISLTLENTSTQPATGLHWETPAFAITGKAKITGAVNPQPASVAGVSVVPIVVDATLTDAGTYRGLIRLAYGAAASRKALTLPVEVTRVRPALNIDVADLAGMVYDIPLGKSEPVPFRTHVQNNDTSPITLRTPLLRSITWKSKTDSTTSSAASSVSVRFDPPEPPTLKPDEDTEVTFALDGIERPGLYTAIVRLGSAGTTPVDKTLVVYARQSYWILFLWVAAGMLLSFWYRTYSGVIRPRLALERKASLLLDQLRDYIRLAGDDVEAVAFLQALQNEFSNAWNPLAQSGLLVGSSALDIYPTRVALAGQWLDRWKGIAGVRPESVRNEYQTKLRAVATALLTSATTDFAAQQTILDTLPQELDKSLIAELDRISAAFAAELTKRSADQRFDPLLAEVTRIRGLLQPATLTEAVKALDAVRRRYLDIVAGDFVASLDASNPVPGFTAATWSAVIERARAGVLAAQQEGDAETAMTAYAQAVGAYLRSVAKGLGDFVQEKITNGSKQTAAYQAAQPQIVDIVTNVDAGKLDEAMNVAAQAVRSVTQIVNASGAGGQEMATMAALVSQLPAASGLDLFSDFFRRAPLASQLGRGAVQRIDSSLRALDWLGAVIAVLLTMLIAYQALWASDLTWGGPLACVAAVLWGAGIHQLVWSGVSSVVTALKG